MSEDDRSYFYRRAKEEIGKGPCFIEQASGQISLLAHGPLPRSYLRRGRRPKCFVPALRLEAPFSAAEAGEVQRRKRSHLDWMSVGLVLVARRIGGNAAGA
jgi:hypothetical protein